MPSPDDLGLFFSGVCTISAVEPFSGGCMSGGLEAIKRSARSIGDSGGVLDPLSSAWLTNTTIEAIQMQGRTLSTRTREDRSVALVNGRPVITKSVGRVMMEVGPASQR
jgi:hypothetical protein